MTRSAAVWFLGLASLGSLVSGCEEERSQRVAASYSSVTRPTYPVAPKAAAAQAPVGIDAIPVEEDYEERAEANITEANLLNKLTELEKEMAF